MRNEAGGGVGDRLEDFIEAFEQACAGGAWPCLTDYLPEPGHPLYLAVLTELIRADLEYSWKLGQPRRVEDYQPLFPQLFQDRTALQPIAFEEYRLRRQAGETPSPVEYLQRFGFPIGFWPRPR